MMDVFSRYWDWFSTTSFKLDHDEITALSTLAIAVFAGVLAVVARRQSKDTRILQRAYLTVRPAGIHILGYRDEAVAHVEICNAGNLPATMVKWFIKHDFSSRLDWFTGEIDTRLVAGAGSVLAPHAEMAQASGPIEVGPDALRHQDGRYLYVWGAVTYRDGFGKKRSTTFCHRYDCANAPEKLEQGTVAMSGITAREHRYGNRTR